MQARMGNPAMVVPGALQALLALDKATKKTGVSATTLTLVHLRASQINGCGVCVHMHARDLRKSGESDERIDTVAGWRDTPYFTDAERAALALAEAVTRLSDRGEVPDEIYDKAAQHFDEQQLAALIASIALVNLWNRLNITTRQVAGADWS
ncbi:carboxymuconolactone decarboxylase family protein [Pseudonocardia sp.]|jgi:AhpD family alkylhydroperoxidase|uniref:carboxymuconolactone decarboxylase family protein n=1 Tax=Pseudonocardia sp. TaxID=60912 RepID=UPI0031FCDABD